jgi:hypothetical protein
VLLYAYAIGVRSSRQIERRCIEDRAHGPVRGDELPAELASPSGRLARLRQAKAELETEAAERQRRYQQRVAEPAAAARAKGKQPRAHIKPRTRDEAPNPNAVANTTDPDSRFLHTRNGTVQGYNAQAVVTQDQVVVAAALTRDANDLQQLQPMLAAVSQTLDAAEIDQRPGMLLAESGYWSIANLGSEAGKPSYATRKQTVEPMFGQLKEQQGACRFLRRGLAACEAEWKLLCGTHNLLKLWRYTRRQAAATAIAT